MRSTSRNTRALLATFVICASLGARRDVLAQCKKTCASLEVLDSQGCCRPLFPQSSSFVLAIEVCPLGMVRMPGESAAPAVARKGAPLGEFCLDLNEVTVGDYARCVEDNNTCTDPDSYTIRGDSQFCNWNNPAGRAAHPINCVDWYQATQFCAWRKKRLPTEEEWEWAARGGDKRWPYPWGNVAPSSGFGSKPPKGFLNACGIECVVNMNNKYQEHWIEMYSGDDGAPETAPVRSFPADVSRWGALDLAGNVSEWTSTVHTSDDEFGNHGTPSRVARGGSWSSRIVAEVTTTHRFIYWQNYRSNSLGFRCALTP
jgi:formylglycine-generating enzyme required for sulfatase activity